MKRKIRWSITVLALDILFLGMILWSCHSKPFSVLQSKTLSMETGSRNHRGMGENSPLQERGSFDSLREESLSAAEDDSDYEQINSAQDDSNSDGKETLSEESFKEPSQEESVTEEAITEDSKPEDAASQGSASEESAPSEAVSENSKPEESASYGAASEESVSEEIASQGSPQEESVWEDPSSKEPEEESSIHAHQWGAETDVFGDGLTFQSMCGGCEMVCLRNAIVEQEEFYWVCWYTGGQQVGYQECSTYEECRELERQRLEEQFSTSWGNDYRNVVVGWSVTYSAN